MSETKYKMVPLKDIRILPERGRKSFEKLQELAASIKETGGLINPLYVVDDDKSPGKYILTAGERRYRAIIMGNATIGLGMEMVPVSYREGLSEIDQKIIELEENIGRQDLDWQEESFLRMQVHELRCKKNPNWTQQQTAEVLSVSPALVSKQIKMAKELQAHPELRAEIKNLDMNSAIKVVENRKKVQKMERLKESGQLTLSQDLKLGSCVDLIKTLPDNSVDLLLTDPPYGLEALEDLRKGDGSVMQGHAMMSKTHNMSIDEVLATLKTLAPELRRVMKAGAHFYVFAAYEYAGDFIKALSPLEFQPPILHWDRGRNTSPGYGYNYLNKFECIIYGHNPPRGRRLQKNMYNVFEIPTVSNNERLYPTEKPVTLLKTFIQQSTNLGDMVLDPFAGSASTLKAAKSLGRQSIGFEIDKDAFARAQLVLGEIKE